MDIKICMFLFTIFMVQITLVKSWATLPTKATRRDLTEKEIKEFRETIQDFVDNLAFGHLWKSRLWDKKSNKGFHNCMNENSSPYNLKVLEYRGGISKYLIEYKEKSYYEYKYLIDEIRGYVTDIFDLLEEVRNKFYFDTQKTSFEEGLKQFRKQQKAKIEEKFIAIQNNMKTIKHHIRLDDHVSDFNNYQQWLKNDFKTIEEKTIEFYKSIKQCMGV